MIRYAAAATLVGLALAAPATGATVPATTIRVVGDLATADRVAVLVPGVATTPANLDRTLGAAARALHTAALADDPAVRVAVVAWLGYAPPDGLGLESALERRARAGAVALDQYVDTLVAARPTAEVTLVGHSYGALVVGLAAHALPPQVTDLVALGAPGMGADKAADLHTTAQVWAAESTQDWIRWIPEIRILGLGHGTHPASPSFGAHELPTEGVRSHDAYLTPGSTTLSAVVRVVTR